MGTIIGKARQYRQNPSESTECLDNDNVIVFIKILSEISKVTMTL